MGIFSNLLQLEVIWNEKFDNISVLYEFILKLIKVIEKISNLREMASA